MPEIKINYNETKNKAENAKGAAFLGITGILANFQTNLPASIKLVNCSNSLDKFNSLAFKKTKEILTNYNETVDEFKAVDEEMQTNVKVGQNG